MNKIETLKKLIEVEEDDLKFWEGLLEKSSDKYIGDKLVEEEKRYSRYIQEAIIKAEALRSIFNLYDK